MRQSAGPSGLAAGLVRSKCGRAAPLQLERSFAFSTLRLQIRRACLRQKSFCLMLRVISFSVLSVGVSQRSHDSGGVLIYQKLNLNTHTQGLRHGVSPTHTASHRRAMSLREGPCDARRAAASLVGTLPVWMPRLVRWITNLRFEIMQ